MKKNRIYGLMEKIGLFKMIKIMRFTIFILFLSLSQTFAVNTYSQQAKLSLDMRNARLEDVLDRIEKNSEFFFMYNKNMINVDRKVDIRVEEKNVNEVLNKIFANTDISYSIKDRQILLINSSMADTGNESIFQQQKSISGKVSDSSGGSLPGVSVVVKGTTNGTITDANGNYSLSNIPSNATIQFSFVGMKTQEIATGGKTTINIALTEDAIGIEEVVAVGYGTQKKVSLTGTITTVNAQQIESIPASNLSNTLAGRAPGVTITKSSGFAGATSDILIRGKGTFNNTSPLYVIDGIIMDKTDFDVLDPNEVENISFLKDAATASIYGSRAASGVVLVTTKKGKIQKPVFNYKVSVSTDRTTRPIQDWTATDDLKYQNDAAATLGNPVRYSQEILDYFKDKSYSAIDYVWQNPTSKQHDLSVNGGNDNLTYYMLVGYNQSNASFKNTDYDRYNFRSNVTAKINDYIDINLNLSGDERKGNRFYWPSDGSESSTLEDIYRGMYRASRLYPFYVDKVGNPTTDQVNGYPVMTAGWHPIEVVNNGGYRKTDYRTLNGIFRINVKIPFVDGLSTSFLGNYNADDYNGKNFIKHNKFYIFQQASVTNKFVPGPIDPNKTGVHTLGSPYERVDENASFSKSYQLNWFLDYNKVFGKNTVSGMLVYERQSANGKNFGGYASELLSSSVDQIIAASQSNTRRWFDGSEWATARASWIGRLHYEYANKYIIEFSGRYDGSYIFPENSRWGFFPSASAAWRLSEEEFFNVPVISNLKLRGSIGNAGNDNVAAFQFQTNYVLGSTNAFGNSIYTGIKAGTPPNPNITWEKSTNYDIGFDFGLFDNKLTGDFDYFYRYSYDILYNRVRVIPATYGANLSSENYAKTDVRGLEFSLNYNDKIGKFNYSIGGNIGWAKDKVLYIDEPTGLPAWRSAIGHPMNRVFGYDDYGIIHDQATLDALPQGYTQFGQKPVLGAILFKDLRSANLVDGPDGKIDANDKTYLSDNAIPRINYGINLNGDWKGISLNLLFQGVGSFDRMLQTKEGVWGYAVVQNADGLSNTLWLDRWTPENPNSIYPRAAGWLMPQFGSEQGRVWLRNGAYMRLKNVNLAYTLPKKWTMHLLIDKCQIYLNATNLFCITGLKEQDPEQYSLESYPIMKTFTAGLNINF